MFLANKDYHTILRLERLWKQFHGKSFKSMHPDEKCIGCFLGVEGHSAWEDAECAKVSFEKKDNPFTKRKDIEAIIQDLVDREKEAGDKNRRDEMMQKSKNYNDEQAADI
ncbi:hypothetical protein vBValSX1_135 [Vibrio phage vB_ValS_X1]|uniref:Uncharacterized protein n=1 Tax=Vibrio phage vB_ValS_X1 TaxID=2736341 RepID=A0A6M9Z6U7_9CAUD|nr:hypothetical protein vBValSX1_135 [Vibrio phage vB_ValS_X1]